MNGYVILLYNIVFISLLSCGNHSSKTTPLKKESPKNWEVAQAKPVEPAAVANKWLFPEAWGEPIMAIDFLNTKLLREDSRVSQPHKDRYPALCDEYVLWRVKHDGSCWVSSGMTQLIFHMIEAGGAKFDEAVAQLEAIFAADKRPVRVNNPEVVEDFFDILGLIRAKMDHRFSLELRNHSKIYLALDRGFRALIASNLHNAGRASAWVEVIERPGEWGFVVDFQDILWKLGFKYGELSCDGIFGQSPCKQSFSNFRAYLSNEEQALLVGESPQARQLLRNTMPVVMSIVSSPGYIDVAVRKDFSKLIID